MQGTDVLIGCAVGIVLAILGYSIVGRLQSVYAYYKQSKKSKDIVFELLQLSIMQRSTYRLKVLQGEFKEFTAEGIATGYDKKFFVLQVTHSYGVHQWVNTPISMFFPVTNGGCTTFYHFTSITSKANRNDSYTELYFVLPPMISPGQNRAFLRFTPLKHDIKTLGLWLIPTLSPLPTHKKELTKPFLTSRLNAENQMVLHNVSAGGMCIFIHNRYMPYDKSHLKAGANLLFLLILATKAKKEIRKAIGIPFTPEAHANEENAQDEHIEQAQNNNENNTSAIADDGKSGRTLQPQLIEGKPLALWLSCRVCALTHMEKNDIWQLNLRFENWSLIQEKVDVIEWFPTDTNQSIPLLATWIMRAHMETLKKHAV